MRALILAAGEGTRLRPYTEKIPKPMLEIGGRPILEHNVRLAVKHGITDIVINTHHRADSIVEHFGDGSAYEVSITYSYEPVLLGTAGALNPVREKFKDGTFVVMYGDNLTDLNLSAVIERHRGAHAVATIALWWREDPTASGIVGLDEEGYVTRFLEKPKPEEVFSKWINAGTLVLEPAALHEVPLDGHSDFGRDILPKLLAEKLPIAGYKMSEGLWWIDSQVDYDRTKADFAHER